MKLLLYTLLVVLLGALPASAQKRYYVAINPTDCTNCLATGSLLPSYPFYKNIRFVLPAAAKRISNKLISELVQVPIAGIRIIANDSLYQDLNRQGPSSIVVKEGKQTVFRAQLTALGNAEVDNALLAKFKPLTRQQLLPESYTLSSASRLYCGQSRAWVFDPRFGQIIEFSYAHPERLIEFHPKSWSLIPAYRGVHGDTVGLAKMRALLPLLRRIGKDKLEVLSLYHEMDTLYATVVFREAQQVTVGSKSSVGIFPRVFLVRFQGGQPTRWRYLGKADSTEMALGFPRALQRINRTKWLFPVLPLEGEKAPASPFLAWAQDNGREIRWAGAHKARLPVFFTARHLQSNYTDYYLNYPYLVFQFSNQLLSLEKGNGQATIPDLSDTGNDFTNLTQPIIRYEVEDVIKRQGNLAMVVKQDDDLYFSVLDENLQVLWTTRLPVSASKTVRWALSDSRILYGLDSETNQLISLPIGY